MEAETRGHITGIFKIIPSPNSQFSYLHWGDLQIDNRTKQKPLSLKLNTLFLVLSFPPQPASEIKISGYLQSYPNLCSLLTKST